MRLAIRGYGNGVKVFEERVDAEAVDLEALGRKHMKRLLLFDRNMIEVEFLDEPNPLKRFFRFGNDPTLMVMPIVVSPQGPTVN